MEEGPKSFWAERDRVETAQWITLLDDLPALAQEAEIIHALSYRSLPLPIAEEMELWEIAAYLGLHRIETREEHDAREIVAEKEAYYDETGAERAARVVKVAEARKQRALERRRAKAKQ